MSTDHHGGANAVRMMERGHNFAVDDGRLIAQRMYGRLGAFFCILYSC
jgi:hypothetical protein